MTQQRRPLLTKTRLNFGVDLLAFAAFFVLTVTGLLIRWTLPPGSGGRHGGESLAVWGMTRHQWGNLHFWLAVALLALLGLHILLHWRWIVHVVRGKKSEEHSGKRLALGLASLVALVVVGLTPFLSGAEKRVLPGGHDEAGVASERPGGRGRPGAGGDEHAGEPASEHAEHALRGRSTVREAAEHLGLEVPELLERLGLPADTVPDQRLGPLLRDHQLSMDDVRRLGDSGI